MSRATSRLPILGLCAGVLLATFQLAQAQILPGCGDEECNPTTGGTHSVVGQSPPYKVLGSPSGRAHQDVFGQLFKWVVEGGSGHEIWLQELETSNVRLRQGTLSPSNILDCDEHAAIGVYLEATPAGNNEYFFYPTFGGNGNLQGAIEIDLPSCGPTYCDIQGLTFEARSTDIDNDGDTDDADQNLLIAAIGTNNLHCDLNFNGSVTPADLSVLLTEKNRGVYAWDCSPVTNLAVAAVAKTNIKLTWTAAGDVGGSGQAPAYDLRYRLTPFVDEEDFEGATQVNPSPSPASAGTPECFVVAPLTKCKQYYFAIKRSDGAGHGTRMSNVASGTTTCNGNILLNCGGFKASLDVDASNRAQLRIVGTTVATSGASFRIEVPQGLALAPARVAVYDARGRQVRSLLQGNLSSGNTALEWDLLDSSGARSGSGVYFVRAEIGGQVLKHQIVLMR